MRQLDFEASLAEFGDGVALLPEDGPCLTYCDLDREVEVFREKIVGDRQLVCILCGPNVATVVGYLAALRGGHVAMMVPAELDKQKLARLLECYEPEWILEPVRTGGNHAWQRDGYELRNLRSCGSGRLHDGLALLLSTSGSTGSPKMVRLTRKNIFSNAASIVQYLDLDHRQRAITSLPIHYSYGLSVLNTHLAVGGSLVLTGRSMMTREFWELCRAHEVTSLSGVPYHYEILLRLRFFSMALPRLRTLTQAGGKLNPRYVRQFAEYAREKNIRFFTMYGQTEATARISYLPPDRVLDKPDSIGIPVPGGRLWLRDADGNPIESEGRQGELVYEGPNVMMGYATCRKDLALGDLLHGTLFTGDLARRDHDGFFTITGRMKRFVKVFGNRINLDEVERMLKEKGVDAVCGGEDDALLVLVTDESVAVLVKEFLAKATGMHHGAIRVRTVPRFCFTDSGKINYQQTFASVSSA